MVTLFAQKVDRWPVKYMDKENQVVTPQTEDNLTDQPLNEEGIKQMTNGFEEGAGELTTITEQPKQEEQNQEEEKEEEKNDFAKIAKENEDLKQEIEEKNTQLTASQTEALRLKREVDKAGKTVDETKQHTEDVMATIQRREEDKILDSFWGNHQNILPKDALAILKEARETGNNELIYENEFLRKLDEEFKSIVVYNPQNSLQDFDKRLEKAFNIAFRDKIIESLTKQTQAKTEMEIKEKEKSASPGGAGGGKSTSAYTSEQIDVAHRMGVELK